MKLPNPCEPGCHAISNCNYDLLADSDLESNSLESHPVRPNLRRFALIQSVAFPVYLENILAVLRLFLEEELGLDLLRSEILQ